MKQFRSTITSLSAVMALLSSPTVFAADTTGVTDTEVKIGAHTSETGRNALSSAYAIAVRTYFAEVNKAGGVHGRKINWLGIDTQAVEAKTYDATRTMVETDKIFAMVGGQGPSHLGVWKYLKEKGVPDLLIASSDKDYVEPISKTVFPAYYVAVTEGHFMGKLAVKRFPGKKVCWFVTNDSQSEQFELAAKKGVNEENAKLKDSEKVILGPTQKVERMASQANSEMLKLSREKCEVVISRPYGPIMAAAINFSGSQGFNPNWILQISNVNSNFLALIKSLSDRKMLGTVPYATADGMGAYDYPAYKNFLVKTGLRDSGSTARGFFVAELFTEALKRAGKNLNRESIITALESLGGYKCSLCAAPIELSATNHEPVKTPLVVQVRDGKWGPVKD